MVKRRGEAGYTDFVPGATAGRAMHVKRKAMSRTHEVPE
jgi:hypothetical protein